MPRKKRTLSERTIRVYLGTYLTSEARTKRCPQVGDGTGLCIADECMAWRVDPGRESKGFCGVNANATQRVIVEES